MTLHGLAVNYAFLKHLVVMSVFRVYTSRRQPENDFVVNFLCIVVTEKLENFKRFFRGRGSRRLGLGEVFAIYMDLSLPYLAMSLSSSFLKIGKQWCL